MRYCSIASACPVCDGLRGDIVISDRVTLLLVLCGMLATPGVAAAQGRPVPVLITGRGADGEQPTVDGRIDEAIWARVQPFTAFIQQDPDEGEPATERTEIRLLLDRQNLYIAVICFDSEPDRILVSQSRRDADLDDTDSIRILLDTFNDGQNAFVFATNPFGIECDGQVMAEGQTGQGVGRAGASM